MALFYFYTGVIVVWLLVATAIIYAVSLIIKYGINYLGKTFKVLWNVAAYIYYRKQFHEFMSTKNEYDD